jgi:hypothetical protein
MAIGLFIIVTSINFYFTAQLASDLESGRLICSAGAFFVGGVLLLSTYGRYRKAKEARKPTAPSEPSLPSSATPQGEDRSDHGDRDDQHDQP